jgi:hypothetical protein
MDSTFYDGFYQPSCCAHQLTNLFPPFYIYIKIDDVYNKINPAYLSLSGLSPFIIIGLLDGTNTISSFHFSIWTLLGLPSVVAKLFCKYYIDVALYF